VIMAIAAFGSYSVLGGALGLAGSRLGMLIAMVISILIAVIVYAAAVIVTGALTREDMRFVPKGEKIASILRLR